MCEIATFVCEIAMFACENAMFACEIATFPLKQDCIRLASVCISAIEIIPIIGAPSGLCKDGAWQSSQASTRSKLPGSEYEIGCMLLICVCVEPRNRCANRVWPRNPCAGPTNPNILRLGVRLPYVCMDKSWTISLKNVTNSDLSELNI